MLKSPTADFRSEHQFQVFQALQQPNHITLSVAATGSGKTLPYQLSVFTALPGKISIMIEPYSVLFHEMLARMKALGLRVEVYDRSGTLPDAHIVLVPLESFTESSRLWDALVAVAETKKLQSIVVDEARKSDYAFIWNYI